MTKTRNTEKLSLHPLKLRQAISDLLKVKPQPKKTKRRKK